MGILFRISALADDLQLLGNVANAVQTEDIADDQVVCRCGGVRQQTNQGDQHKTTSAAEARGFKPVPNTRLRSLVIEGPTNDVGDVGFTAEDVGKVDRTEIGWVELRQDLTVPDLGEEPTERIRDMAKSETQYMGWMFLDKPSSSTVIVDDDKLPTPRDIDMWR